MILFDQRIMFIETKSNTSILNYIFIKSNCMSSTSNKEYYLKKYYHLINCLYILSKVYPNVSFNLKQSVILHDIGCFYNKFDYNSFDHALVGYNILCKYGIKSKEILYPIKYHENDETWKSDLKKEFTKQRINVTQMQNILYNTSIVKDIDIISNILLSLQTQCCKKEFHLSVELINCLLNKKLGNKIFIKNDADKIVYQLCGLSIINNSEIILYIKNGHIIQKSILTLSKLLNNNESKHFKLLEHFLIENYL